MTEGVVRLPGASQSAESGRLPCERLSACRWRARRGRLVGEGGFGGLSANPDVHRICLRISEHFEGYMAFLGRDDIPWNNNGTERDLRPMCIVRKISGGTRSELGSSTSVHWMSITQTLRKNGTDIEQWVPIALDAVRFGRPLPSVFGPPS